MELRSRSLSYTNFKKGGGGINTVGQNEHPHVISGNLLDIDDHSDVSPVASPLVSHYQTPSHKDSVSVMANDDVGPTTSGIPNDLRALLMEIKDTFASQINEIKGEVLNIKSQISSQKQGMSCSGNNFSQNSVANMGAHASMRADQVIRTSHIGIDDHVLMTNSTQNMSGTNSLSNQLMRDEPKPRSPFFNGKGDFKAFWTQFTLLCNRFHWQNDRQVEELMLNCLRDDALVFVNELPLRIRADIDEIHKAMEQRFGDHILPETYRTNLQFVKQINKESLHDYASRVEKLVIKAYPEIQDAKLLDRFKTEHFIKGLPDQSVAYEVLLQKPSTMQDAINMVSWHECCRKNVGKKCDIRQIESPDYCLESNVFEVCRTQTSYVTHTELKSSLEELRKDHKADIEQVKQGQEKLAKLVSSQGKFNARQGQGNPGIQTQGQNRGRDNNRQKNGNKSMVCYCCDQEGHISKYCPFKGKESEHKSSTNGTQSQVTGAKTQGQLN